jgi:hypothetical protein
VRGRTRPDVFLKGTDGDRHKIEMCVIDVFGTPLQLHRLKRLI